MITKLGARIARFLLTKGNLSVEDATLLTGTILDKLGALPFHEVIGVNDQNELVVNGRPLDFEQVKRLRESANVALENQALAFIREQVAFTAVTNGVHKAETPVQMLFARAALWYHQQMLTHLKELAQKQELPL